jgi:hypothetical protein
MSRSIFDVRGDSPGTAYVSTECVREIERVCVCVCVCEREREGQTVCRVAPKGVCRDSAH